MNQKEVRQRWKALCENLQSMEKNLLKLARHPDTTVTEFETARRAYASAWTRAYEMRQRVEQVVVHPLMQRGIDKISLTDAMKGAAHEQ